MTLCIFINTTGNHSFGSTLVARTGPDFAGGGPGPTLRMDHH